MTPATEPPLRVEQTVNPAKTAVRRVLLGAAIAGFIVYLYRSPNEVKHPPGIVVPEAPYQTQTDRTASWEFKGHKFTPLAYIRLRARVLHTERYWFDAGSRISPVDLALGWGPMSDQRVIDRYEFSQGGRWYYWKAKDGTRPLTDSEAALYSANMHLIPSTPDIDKRLRDVRAGDIVHLSGDLVVVEAPRGWKWTSSLSRTDRGGGSCEVIWVKDLSVR